MKIIDQVYTGRTAAEYDAKRAPSERWAREHEVISPLLRSISIGAAVLDVAAGTGRWLDIYAERDLRPTLLDSSADMLAVARMKAGRIGVAAEFVVASAVGPEAFPAGKDWFVVTNFFNWISLADVERVLTKLRDAGAHNGIVMISYLDPDLSLSGRARAWAKVRLNNLRSMVGMREKGIYHLHTRDNIVSMLDRLQFVTEREHHVRTVSGRKNVVLQGHFRD